MITVTIAINDKVIFARSAQNKINVNKKGETEYLVDDGSKVWHRRGKGCVPLAIKLLETIKEQL